MIKTWKKLMNKSVYENSAEYPWARFKDFIVSHDGKYIEKVLIESESLIPISYTVDVSDFMSIGEKRAVLKPGVKPLICKIEKKDPYRFSNIKKCKVKDGGKSKKIFDMSFDTEIGEIVDFILLPAFLGQKEYLSAGDERIGYLLKNNTAKLNLK